MKVVIHGLLGLCLLLLPALASSSELTAQQDRFAALHGVESDAVACDGSEGVDCSFFLGQGALRSKLARELVSPHMDERIEKLEVTCLDGRIRMSGSFDGPLCIDPGFSTELQLVVVDGSTIDLRFRKTKVVGFGLNFFSKIVCKLVRERVLETGRDLLSVETLEKDASGAHGLRMKVDARALLPAVESPVLLKAIHLGPSGMRIDFRLP